MSNENVRKEEFYFKSFFKYIGYIYITMGIVLFYILTTKLGGQMLFAPVMFVIIGIVWIYRSSKAQLTMYDNYFETSNIKQFYEDIVSMERKKSVLIFLFANGEKKKIALHFFDDETQKTINKKFDEIISKNNKGINNEQ